MFRFCDALKVDGEAGSDFSTRKLASFVSERKEEEGLEFVYACRHR